MIRSRVVSIMLTEEEIEEQIKKKTEQLINTISEVIKTKNIIINRITDKDKEQLEIIIVLETGNTIKEVLDIYETQNRKGQATNVCLLSTPRIVTMSYLFGYLDSSLIRGRFDTLK